jgi:hypothetical protein
MAIQPGVDVETEAVPISPSWQRRARVAGVLGALALLDRLASPSLPPRSIEGVAQILGDAVDGRVRPGEFVWEEPEGLLSELVFGRRVLFLAAPVTGEPRDLYRARVRLSVEGQPLAVRSLHNLTASPLGDDVGLAADGPHAQRYVAFATTSYGSISGVTLLDLQGDGNIEGATSVVDTFLGRLTNLFETGDRDGIGRTSFTFDNQTPSIRLSFDHGRLTLTPPEHPAVNYDLARREFDGPPEELGVTAQRAPHLRKAPILWAVDTVRAVTGPGPIAWLEETFFGARDTLRRTNYELSGTAPALASAVAPGHEEIPPSPPLDASAAGDDGGYWPPPRLPSIWQTPDADEGVWEPVSYPFLRPLPGAAQPPPYFYKTWLKPDPKRPYAKVLMVALDMRQLELNMEGGVEDPKPLTGTKSFGHIPREPEILDRVVGAFNGAFKTTHGAYGMMVNHKVLLPPKAGAATILVTEDAHVGMGTWPASEAIPPTMVSFRQNLDPLVSDGVFNPSGRLIWGYQLSGHSVLTERSGVCVTRPGHFMYFWGDDLSGITLGKAMIQAGCTYGMHLDMNPKHTGFVFSQIRDVKKKDYDVRLLSPQMEILPERYIEWSPKDFFYIMLRDTAKLLPTTEGTKWSIDKGTQPAPAWLPAVHEAQGTQAGATVSLLSIDAGRVAYRVRVGRQEPGSDATTRELGDDEVKRVIAALGLGNAHRPRGLGVVVSGKPLGAFKGGSGYLSTDSEGTLRIAQGEPPSGVVDAVELPLLVINGNLSTSAESSGPSRQRSAACQLPSGRLVFATSTTTSDAPNAMVLARLGCKLVVALDRGSHDEGFWQRAGVTQAQVARSEQSVLYAVGVPMKPRAFPWKP